MWTRIIVAVVLIAVGLVFAVTRNQAVKERAELDINAALEAAGENRAGLEQVIAHFTEKGDSLMLDAACWLIGNMEGHSYVTYALVDSLDDTLAWDATAFPTYDSLTRTFEGLEKNHPGLDFKSRVEYEDIKTIQAHYLIENIELAFEAWRTKPWAKGLSYEDFREGVLPYRGSNEPIEPWRRELMERYRGLEAKMKDPTDPIEAAALINDDIKTWFTFDERWYYHPTDQGLAEMKKTGLGRCEDMTNLTIYAMRANGIAVTSDYTPYWANSGNNHAWNAIILPGGKAIPFMGAEANPGQYELGRKAAKVYRKSYASQPGNLAFIKDDSAKVPRWLGGKSYTDVTAAYGPVKDVDILLDSIPPDSVQFAYLCVFNDGEWKPIHWAEIHGRRATFTDMARQVAYLPAYYLNEKIVPAGEAFVLGPDTTRRELGAMLEEPIDITCAGIMSRAMDKSSETVAGSRLKIGVDYEMYFWDGEWKSIGHAVAGDDPLMFLAPSNGLYRLVANGAEEEARIFTWEGGEQVWW